MVKHTKFRSFSKLIVLHIICFITCDCSSNVTKSVPEFDNRILDGKPAAESQFPYQVSLQLHRKHNCGGSIISEVKVLTAGHCLTDDDGRRFRIESLRILAGTNHLNNNEPKNYYLVKTFSIHGKFVRSTVQYDYGVIFIKGQFDFHSSRISMIPLARQNPLPGTICYVSGWGDINRGDRTKVPNELRFTTITIDRPNECKRLFFSYFIDTHMLCAGKTNQGNAGHGDSGGPMVCNSLLSGIVSYGTNYDDDPSLPDVYSSVAYEFDWIVTANGTANGSRKYKVRGFYSVTIFTVLFISLTMLSIQT